MNVKQRTRHEGRREAGGRPRPEGVQREARGNIHESSSPESKKSSIADLVDSGFDVVLVRNANRKWHSEKIIRLRSSKKIRQDFQEKGRRKEEGRKRKSVPYKQITRPSK
jgi:hypothetical protein